MKTYKDVTITKQEAISITCDVCKKEFSTDIYNADCMEVQEFISIAFTGGYASIFGDGDSFELDMCQDCLKEKLGDYLREV